MAQNCMTCGLDVLKCIRKKPAYVYKLECVEKVKISMFNIFFMEGQGVKKNYI